MKQLKKVFVFALLLSVVGAFTACGNKESTTGDKNTTVDETERADVSPSPETDDNLNDATENGTDSNRDNNQNGTVGDVVEDVGDGVEQGVDGVIDGVENATDDMTNGGDNNKTASPAPTGNSNR